MLERGHHCGVELDKLVALVLVTHGISVGHRVIFAPGSWRIEGQCFVGLHGLQSIDDLFGVELQVLRQLIYGGRTPVLVGECLLCVAYLQRALLVSTRHVKRPAAVAEISSHLTEDRRHREGGKRMTSLWIEAIQSLEQSERGNLYKVLEGLGGAVVASCEVARERHEPLHQRIARYLVSPLLPACEKHVQFVIGAWREAGTGCDCGDCSHLNLLPGPSWIAVLPGINRRLSMAIPCLRAIMRAVLRLVPMLAQARVLCDHRG